MALVRLGSRSEASSFETVSIAPKLLSPGEKRFDELLYLWQIHCMHAIYCQMF